MHKISIYNYFSKLMDMTIYDHAIVTQGHHVSFDGHGEKDFTGVIAYSTQRTKLMKNNSPQYYFNLIIRKCRYISFSIILFPTLVTAETIKLVEVAKVESWNHGATHTIHCEVETPNTYLLSSHNSARLKWALPEGTQVIRGQLIAEQNSHYIALRIERLKIEIESANVQQEYTSSEHKRIRSLNEKSLVSSSRLNDMYRLSIQASLSKKRLEQQLKELQHRAKNLKHFAPVNGQILSMEAQPLEYLADGQTILELQPNGNKELICELPLKKYRQHNQLATAKFTLTNNVDLTLNRSSLSLKEDSQTLALYLHANQHTQRALLLGERLTVVVSYQSKNIARVPHDALELADDAYYVWKLNEDKSVNRLAVDIVSTQDDAFLVKSSLQGGDHVVTFGKQGLAEKQQVKFSLEDNKDVSL
jgi:multidrug efflux system membrane fusion protein